MTVLHSGSNNRYSSNWGNIFGRGKKAAAAGASTKKRSAAQGAKTAKKAAKKK